MEDVRAALQIGDWGGVLSIVRNDPGVAAKEVHEDDEGVFLLTALLTAGTEMEDASSAPPPDLLLEVLSAFPEAARETSPSMGGCLPLHLAAMSLSREVDLSTFRAILRAFPQGARQKDHSGFLPLIYAACNPHENFSVGAVTELLCTHPEGAREQTCEHGSYPLHVAVADANSPAVNVAALVRAFPEACKDNSQDGWLPVMHWARRRQQLRRPDDVRVLLLLLEAYPNGVHQRDWRENKSAIEHATTIERAIALIWWGGSSPPAAAAASDKEWSLASLEAFARDVLSDHSALVEFRLCTFSARRTMGHPLYALRGTMKVFWKELENLLAPSFFEARSVLGALASSLP